MFSRRLNWLAGLLLATISFTFRPDTASGFAPVETELPLITLQQFCEMERLDVEKRVPVRLRGTVTRIEREWKTLCIQSKDHAVSVVMETDADMQIGQLVELIGRPEFGDFKTVFMLTDSRVIGDGTLPTPFHFDPSQTLSPELLFRWSHFEGDIYSAVEDDNRVYLSVSGPSFGVYMMLPKSSDLPPLSELRTSRIKANGVPVFSSEPSAPWRLDLHVPAQGILEITPNGKSTDQPSLRKTSEIWKKVMRGAVEEPVRIRAVVRAVSAQNRIFISDEAGALVVEVSDNSTISNLTPGDVVEVQGPADRDSVRMLIKDAEVRYIGKGYSHAPASVEPLMAKEHLAELIKTSGILVAASPSENWLMLRQDGQYFRVRYLDKDEQQVERLDVGSSLTVSGGCWLSSTNDAYFELAAQSLTSTFSVPATPSAGNTENTINNFDTHGEAGSSSAIDELVRPLLMMSFLILLVALIWQLRRRMKKQQKFYDSIHEQLSNLSHIARINTLAEMVGALAHELSQPLASVSNYAATAEFLSKKDPTDSEKLASVLTHIGQEAFRAGEIIRRLRHLVRRKTPGSLPVKITEIIHETVELFKTQHVTASGLVQLDVTDSLPAVQADSVQIQQVILNLLLNARDATEAQSDRTPAIQVETSSEDGMIYVTVSDNGIGIASATPDAIFEPYFTTREKGTGLGLAISRTIIETHGGKITAQKVSPFGTRITFSLPISKGPTNI